MKLIDLKKFLKAIRAPEDAYSIGKLGRGDNLYLLNEGGRFKVGYYERGSKSDEKDLFDEDEACIALLTRLLTDHSVLEDMAEANSRKQ